MLASRLYQAVNRTASMLLSACCLFVLVGCVTETPNPVFNVERSDEETLEDCLQLAVDYLEENDLASAKRHLNNAAKIDSNNSEIFSTWGLIYAREGEPELADQNFRRSLRVGSNNSKARNNYAAFLMAENRIEDAFAELELVVRDTEYPQRPQAFEKMGIAAKRLNRAEDAERAFMRALQLNPNQLRSTLELTSINLSRGDVLQARAYWRNNLTLIQFYHVEHSARSLLVGARLENALHNETNAAQYGELLRTNFPNSNEYTLYQQEFE
jgi:type IV pilus assembly protein PilF